MVDLTNSKPVAIPFSHTEEDIRIKIVKAFIKTDYVPTDIFEALSGITLKKFFNKGFFMQGTFSSSWNGVQSIVVDKTRKTKAFGMTVDEPYKAVEKHPDNGVIKGNFSCVADGKKHRGIRSIGEDAVPYSEDDGIAVENGGFTALQAWHLAEKSVLAYADKVAKSRVPNGCEQITVSSSAQMPPMTQEVYLPYWSASFIYKGKTYNFYVVDETEEVVIEWKNIPLEEKQKREDSNRLGKKINKSKNATICAPIFVAMILAAAYMLLYVIHGNMDNFMALALPLIVILLPVAIVSCIKANKYNNLKTAYNKSLENATESSKVKCKLERAQAASKYFDIDVDDYKEWNIYGSGFIGEVPKVPSLKSSWIVLAVSAAAALLWLPASHKMFVNNQPSDPAMQNEIGYDPLTVDSVIPVPSVSYTIYSRNESKAPYSNGTYITKIQYIVDIPQEYDKSQLDEIADYLTQEENGRIVTVEFYLPNQTKGAGNYGIAYRTIDDHSTTINYIASPKKDTDAEAKDAPFKGATRIYGKWSIPDAILTIYQKGGKCYMVNYYSNGKYDDPVLFYRTKMNGRTAFKNSEDLDDVYVIESDGSLGGYYQGDCGAVFPPAQ